MAKYRLTIHLDVIGDRILDVLKEVEEDFRIARTHRQGPSSMTTARIVQVEELMPVETQLD